MSRPTTETTMQEVGVRLRRYAFRVKLEATVTVRAARARDARDAVRESLDGATARVVSGTGAGLELDDLGTSANVTLLLVDGVDPTAPVVAALSGWRADGGPN